MRLILITIILITAIFYTYFYKNYENFDNPNIKIFVINLEKSIDRWKYINKQNNQNLNLVKFNAINGNHINKNNIKNLIDNNSYLYKNIDKNRGEIGCALSHLNIWEIFKKSNDKYIIIVEDDVIFEQNLYKKINTYMKNAPKDWDIIYLGGSHIVGYKVNEYFIKPKLNIKGNLGTYAMLINKKGVNKLLKYCKPITKSIDHQIKGLFNYINVYYTYPTLINHNNNMDSDRRILNKQAKRASYHWRNTRQSRIEILN